MSGPVARHRVFAGFVALGALLLIVLNEMCQRLVEAGLLQDRLVFDYVTDAMVVPVIISALIAWRSHMSWPVFSGIAGLLTLVELLGPVDGWDIALYWGTASLMYLLLGKHPQQP